ncbi:MAG: hypothetical protein ACLVIY_10250 [Anaerobutyricum soehngenii]
MILGELREGLADSDGWSDKQIELQKINKDIGDFSRVQAGMFAFALTSNSAATKVTILEFFLPQGVSPCLRQFRIFHPTG